MLLPQVSQVEEGNTNPSSPTQSSQDKKPKDSKCRKWCFTLFDVSDATKKTILSMKNCKYIFGLEVCPSTGREHFQGYFEFKDAKRFSTLKNMFPSIHLEPARGSMEQNYDYCSKDNKYVTNFILKKNVEIIEWNLDHPLRNWQQKIIDSFNKPNYRQITWIFDKKGNNGKSWLCQYILSNYNDCIYFTGGKASDITSQILLCEDFSPKICLFDLPKSSEGMVSYNGIEQCKNGLVNSPKYKGGFKAFGFHPHVIIFANYMPDQSKLISDRWNIINLEDFIEED